MLNLIMFVLMARIIFPIFEIEPGGKQELLAIPIQQVSRVAMEAELEPTEKETINRIIDYDQINKTFNTSVRNTCIDEGLEYMFYDPKYHSK